jgi:hypothetical protein
VVDSSDDTLRRIISTLPSSGSIEEWVTYTLKLMAFHVYKGDFFDDFCRCFNRNGFLLPDDGLLLQYDLMVRSLNILKMSGMLDFSLSESGALEEHDLMITAFTSQAFDYECTKRHIEPEDYADGMVTANLFLYDDIIPALKAGGWVYLFNSLHYDHPVYDIARRCLAAPKVPLDRASLQRLQIKLTQNSISETMRSSIFGTHCKTGWLKDFVVYSPEVISFYDKRRFDPLIFAMIASHRERRIPE